MVEKFYDSLVHIKKDLSWYNTSKKADYRRLLHEYEQGNITGAVVAVMPDDDLYYVAETVTENLPFCEIVFSIPESWLAYTFERICKEIFLLKKSLGIIGIKIHPRFSKISLENIPVIERFIAAAKYNNVLVYLCTILRNPVLPRNSPITSVINNIACISAKNEVDLVLLHGGYTELISTSEIVRDFDNVWLDLSFTFMRFRKSSLALDVGYLFETLDKKCIIGTDFPECNPTELIQSLEKYIFKREDLELTNEKKAAVLFNNMSGLVKKYAK